MKVKVVIRNDIYNLASNFHFIFRDNPRFGINDWHNEWDGPKSYTFGENLNYFQRKKLIRNKKH